MQRPVCQACHQRPCAVNYYKAGQPYFRSRCESCVRRQRGLKSREPRWKTAGFEKKLRCDRCGFRARYHAQIMVYHMDGRLDNVDQKNLRCICRNCEVELAKGDLPWRRGDLEPDH